MMEKILEESFLSCTHVARLVLISYINASEVPIDILKYYVGDLPCIRGLSKTVTVSKLNISSLYSHFKSEHEKGSVKLAKMLFDKSALGNRIIKLKPEVLETIDKVELVKRIIETALIVDEKYRRGYSVLSIQDLSSTSEVDINDVFVYSCLTTFLLPAVMDITEDSKSIYHEVISNFEEYKTLAKQRFNRVNAYTLAKVLLEKYRGDLQKLNVLIRGPIVRFSIPLSDLYKAFEYAYWEYVIQRWKRSRILSRQVILQDLLPSINIKLREMGYLRPVKFRELVEMLITIQENDIKEHYKQWFNIGTKIIPESEDIPVPVEFYEPRWITKKQLQESGLPLDNPQVRSLWKL